MENSQLKKFAIISGFSILIMVVTVPFAEFVIFPDLFDFDNPQRVINNIKSNFGLYKTGVFLHLITLICDVIVSWSLYYLLIETDKQLSLITALFRIVFAVLSLSALLSHVEIIGLIDTAGMLNFSNGELQTNILQLKKDFNTKWIFAFAFFSIHLILLGVLVSKSSYMPTFLGVLLIIAGLGYLLDTIRFFFFPEVDLGFVMVTFFGEIIFMLWLLIFGWRLKKTAS